MQARQRLSRPSAKSRATLAASLRHRSASATAPSLPANALSLPPQTSSAESSATTDAATTGEPKAGERTTVAPAATNPVDWHLGPSVPQTGNTLLARLGYGSMRLFGWKFAGAFPDAPKFVAVVAPHTSNWDFLVLLAAKWALRLDVSWMGKDALFRPPLGWFMSAIGGIPIRRSEKHNVVDASVHAFRERDRMVLVLAPEGTRKYVEDWKSGFWHIARGAGVPIVCIALDYGRKTIALGPEVIPTDDDAAIGIARIRAHYVGVKGMYPTQHS